MSVELWLRVGPLLAIGLAASHFSIILSSIFPYTHVVGGFTVDEN